MLFGRKKYKILTIRTVKVDYIESWGDLKFMD